MEFLIAPVCTPGANRRRQPRSSWSPPQPKSQTAGVSMRVRVRVRRRAGPRETQDPSQTALCSESGQFVTSLWSCAKGAEDDVKKLDLYAAALEIDSFIKASRHPEIAENVASDWKDIRGRDQRTIDEAKMGLVSRFGDAVRVVADRPEPRTEQD